LILWRKEFISSSFDRQPEVGKTYFAGEKPVTGGMK
jgi:hypothetical protein